MNILLNFALIYVAKFMICSVDIFAGNRKLHPTERKELYQKKNIYLGVIGSISMNI